MTNAEQRADSYAHWFAEERLFLYKSTPSMSLSVLYELTHPFKPQLTVRALNALNRNYNSFRGTYTAAMLMNMNLSQQLGQIGSATEAFIKERLACLV